MDGDVNERGEIEPFKGVVMELTKEDLEFIEESLLYTRKSFEEYQSYPSYEYKQQRLKRVNDVLAKIREMKRDSSNK
ncbi:MAG TPA: hypothetical protein VHU19_07400 [Pyrinomonadaceae bacterium]|nr:hypothetical protein [Pyrinomonadaceae bacterium]